MRQDPHLPWLPGHVKRRIDNFELVINSRWPTAQDIYLPSWGRMLLQTLSSWRYALRSLRISGRIIMGAKDGRFAQASLGESLVLVDVHVGYRLWSRSYDHDPNAVLSLERRVLRERLGPLRGRCLLDVATGTGYWLTYALSENARAFGIDVSTEMLGQAAKKPQLRERLIQADMNALPVKDAIADVAICSLALGYVASIGKLFRELARVSRAVIVSDLHECAVNAGWQRSFEIEGRRYQIEHFEHTARELDEAAYSAGMKTDWRISSHLGEPEREIFIRAGREGAFAEACRVPAILSSCWVRS